MTRVEEVPHLRSLFRQFGCDEVQKLNLVKVIRDIALCYLPSEIIAKVPAPHFSEEVRAAHEGNGVSLEWDLSILGDTGIYAFNIAAGHADISKGEKYAAQLLAYCTKAFEENAVSAQLEQSILDTYMCLDVDALESFVEALENAVKHVNVKHTNSLDKMVGQLKADYEEAMAKAEAPLKAKITQLFGAQAKMKSIIEAHKIAAENAS